MTNPFNNKGNPISTSKLFEEEKTPCTSAATEKATTCILNEHWLIFENFAIAQYILPAEMSANPSLKEGFSPTIGFIISINLKFS